MNTMVLTRKTGELFPKIEEFDGSYTIHGSLIDDQYEYISELYKHKLYRYVPTDTLLVYKHYPVDCYEVLVSLQNTIAFAMTTTSSTIYWVGYNEELGVIETFEEYISGKTIAEVIDNQESLSLDDLLYIIEPIADFLDQINGESIILRDLSPSNIILNDKIFPYIIDYNSACINLFSDYVNDKPVGTIGFASPEHFEVESVTSKSDIYSFGLLLNELLKLCTLGGSDNQEIIPLLNSLVLEMTSFNADLRPSAYGLQQIFSYLQDNTFEDDELDQDLIKAYLAD